MILDAKWLFSGVPGASGITGQALSGAGPTASTNDVDLGVGYDLTANQPGVGDEQLYIVVAATAASGGTTPTLTVNVLTADDTGFSTNLQTVASTAVGALKAGDNVVIPFPQTNRRYMRLSYSQGGTTPTNNVIAALTTDPHQWTARADALVGL